VDLCNAKADACASDRKGRAHLFSDAWADTEGEEESGRGVEGKADACYFHDLQEGGSVLMAALWSMQDLSGGIEAYTGAIVLLGRVTVGRNHEHLEVRKGALGG
jgi:putative SOS response-associated peptidase YedK